MTNKLAVFRVVVSVANVAVAQSVSEELLLDVEGTQLYLEVSGPRPDAPIVLYLHGGPGNVVGGVLLFQENVGRQLEEDFLVAYPHQRGAGKSPLVPGSEQTIANHIGDVEKVVDFTEGTIPDGSSESHRPFVGRNPCSTVYRRA